MVAFSPANCVALMLFSKKKPMFLSKQYRHQRALAKEGKGAKFGSYTYTATDLNEKGKYTLDYR
jgi:Ras GTPase-activating-like protein IQGAP2/3